jgi:hypothetical protein
MSATFLINTKAEVFKTRRTAAFWLTIAGAFFIPVLYTVAYIAKPDVFGPELSKNTWITHIERSWQAAAAFLLPMYVILLTSLMVQIEYRNNTWKQVYASPRSYADVYFSKFLVIQLMILSCFFLFDLGIVMSGYIAELAHPKVYKFDETEFPLQRLAYRSSKLYMSILAITAIQYWMSLRIKNYIAPLGIGMVLLIGGLIAFEWDKIIYFPYAYTALTYFKDQAKAGSTPNSHELYSLFWFTGVLLLGFWDTVKRKERG